MELFFFSIIVYRKKILGFFLKRELLYAKLDDCLYPPLPTKSRIVLCPIRVLMGFIWISWKMLPILPSLRETSLGVVRCHKSLMGFVSLKPVGELSRIYKRFYKIN